MRGAATATDAERDALGNSGVRAVMLPGLSGDLISANVKRVGIGRKAVMLHGMLMHNEHWGPILDQVASRWDCTMLELPLLGLRGDDCSIDGVTHLTHQFFDRYVEGPVVIVGSSFGGHVALRLALERKSSVAGLVLAGAAGLSERPITGEVSLRPTREWVRNKIGAMFFDKDKHITDHELDRAHRELSDRSKVRSIVKLTKSSRKDYMGERIRAITVPTLVAWGKQDAITPPEAARDFAARMPNARLVWIDQCGHAPMVEHPGVFARAMNEFADELDRNAPART
jgi:pimeloyl-ACP methyl ester carboxylesterase